MDSGSNLALPIVAGTFLSIIVTTLIVVGVIVLAVVFLAVPLHLSTTAAFGLKKIVAAETLLDDCFHVDRVPADIVKQDRQ